ncbi:MAG: type III CRISPR-associated RAMP protein Csx7 [Gammaproteobacteria bacterium]
MSTIPFGHHELHNRYLFEGTLVPETALRLSSGRASDETDAPLMRDRSGVPYLPGSSLRGAIRSEVERVIAGVGEDVAGIKTCILFCDGDCNSEAREFQQTEAFQESTDKEIALAEFAKNNLCDVCKLLGCTIYASRLGIEDAYPRNKDSLKSRNMIRDGVGIDRDTGAAREGVKFNYEVLEAGSGSNNAEFCLRMRAENVTEPDRKLIDLILCLLKRGLYVGGKRAAGLGRIRLKDDYTVKGFESPQALWQAIMDGTDPHQKINWKEVEDAQT